MYIKIFETLSDPNVAKIFYSRARSFTLSEMNNYNCPHVHEDKNSLF